MKIPNKIELQQIVINHSSDTDFKGLDKVLDKDFMKIYRKCTLGPYSFLVNNTTLLSDQMIYYALEKIFQKGHIINHDNL